MGYLGQTPQTGPPKGTVSLFERVVSMLPNPPTPAQDVLMQAASSGADVSLVDVPQVLVDTAEQELAARRKIDAIREKVRQADLEAANNWRAQQQAQAAEALQYTLPAQAPVMEAGFFSGGTLPLLLIGGAVLGFLFMGKS